MHGSEDCGMEHIATQKWEIPIFSNIFKFYLAAPPTAVDSVYICVIDQQLRLRQRRHLNSRRIQVEWPTR